MSKTEEIYYEETSVCDGCDLDGWDCNFCCAKCIEDFGECPNPECDPYDL